MLSVLNLLKHAHSLVSFVDQFQDFLTSVHICLKSHKVQTDRLIDDSLTADQLQRYLPVFNSHSDQLQLLQDLTNEIQSNYYFEILFSGGNEGSCVLFD